MPDDLRHAAGRGLAGHGVAPVEQRPTPSAARSSRETGCALRDWAEYFCRYARDMLPFEPRETVDLPGDNAVYRREALLAVRDTYRDGFWEPDVNRALRDTGLPAAPLARSSSSTRGAPPGSAPSCASASSTAAPTAASAACASRAAETRSASWPPCSCRSCWSPGRRARSSPAAACAAACSLSLPALVAYDVAWAAGEAAGHLDSLRGR